MPALTSDERGTGSAAQRVQLDRLTAARRDELLDWDRTAGLAKLRSRTADQLKARVNILSVTSGSVNYSPQNDYTSTEQQTIADGLTDGSKWLINVPTILAAGLSVQQRLTALEA